MLLTFLLAAVLWSCNCWWNAANIYTFAVQPGYLDFDNLPDTNFSCDGKVIGGYYADVETGCQMFHVCTIGQKAEITDIKFLCLNGTVFDQETRVCERLDEVDCSKSESFFDLNLELYGNNGAGYGIAPEEPPEQEPVQCNADEEDCSGTPDYFDEDVTTIAGPVVLASTAATTSTTTTSTTARPTTSTTARTTSTTAASAKKPLPAIATTSTTGPAPAVSYPTNSPETIAALIALHNAFQDSLKEREREREREQGPGPKGQQHRYQSPQQQQQQQQQQPLPKPFTVANFQPPRHFPSKAPQPPPPPYRHQQQHRQPQHPVLLSSERFGNQNFRHGFRLQNGPPTQESPPPPPSYQQQQQEQEQEQQQQQQQEQYNLDGGAQYDGSYDDDGAGGIAAVSDDVDVDVDDEESRRNFAREAPEASVSVSVQVSSSSSKNSAIDHQHQQQQRPVQVAVTTVSYAPSSTATATTTTSTTASTATTTTTTTTEGPVTADRDGAARPFTAKPGAQSQEQPPVDDDDADSVDLYGEEYEEWDGGDEEFFKDVPKLGRNRKRRYAVVGGRGWRA